MAAVLFARENASRLLKDLNRSQEDDELSKTTEISSFEEDKRGSQLFNESKRFLFESIADADDDFFLQLRHREFARLDAISHIYLDYTGGGLFPAKLLEGHKKLLIHGETADTATRQAGNVVLGNPHSFNPSSMKSTENVESTRGRVLDYFNADPNEYICIFTSNASGAIKLVGESYPFNERSDFLVTQDNHNSVTGIREYAKQKGATVTHLPMTQKDLRYIQDEIVQYLDQEHKKIRFGKCRKGRHNRLFAYPAQSNASGVQHSLDWVEFAQSRGWHVLLDAAAFVPTNRLDLSKVKPEFVPISFYKIFGYPTGIGALLMKKSVVPLMTRPSFFGGTVWAASSMGDWYEFAHDHERFEEGTVNYLGIPAVKAGLDFMDSVGIDQVHGHVTRLTARLHAGLMRLRHSLNDSKMVEVYGPQNMTRHGGTIFFNLKDVNGTLVDLGLVEKFAMEMNVSIRTGCFCNPGVSEKAFGVSRETLERIGEGSRRSGETSYGGVLKRFGVSFFGGVRVSLGLASNDDDVDKFLSLIKKIFGDKSLKEMQA